MAEDAQNDDLSTQTPKQEGLPERLRVHSLARVLGTTSRRVLDALAEFDGRRRSAHSTVDKVDAERVRDALALSSTEPAPESVGSAEPVQVEAVAVTVAESVEPPAQAPMAEAQEAKAPEAEAQPAPEAQSESEADAALVGDEPESRLILETANIPTVREAHTERADYLPLFVAPQPVAFVPVRVDEDDDDDEEDDADADSDTDSETDDEQEDRPAARRRRRGRRGRGRGRGEQSDENGADSGLDSDTDTADDQGESGDQDSDDDSDESDESSDEDTAGGDGSSRRRRRRRRRKSGSGDNDDTASPDDPPNTVVHERPPRAERSGKGGDDSEIQGISGSTRLEAKRQRRRDGRDAGRRRPPILSEAEFLARREAVERTMIVRDKVRSEPPHEGARYTQIAVLEDGVVVEHFVTSAASASLVGNIYLGIVQNVLPSMEAAFVDIGRGRNGVLYAGEVNWEAAGLGGSNRKIEQALKPGDYVVVQVSKDPVGHKGARLTTQVSLAGRYLVYVPGASSTGISRKLPDTERQRLKEILKEVVPADAGVIIRTASEGVKEEDIRSDVERLQQRWTEIEAKAAEVTEKKAGAAVALYEEPDVLVKVIRDLFNEDFSGLIVSGDDAWDTINKYVKTVAPDLVGRLTKYEPAGAGDGSGPDVFAVHRIDEQLVKAMDRKVWLPSGGTLVIDRTEAMTVVDVNTGKFTGAGGNLEQTVTRNNLEAAEEIVRQLRLRDIGGIVVIDFIDMVLESNRDLVLRRLTEALGRDRTRHQVSEVTSLGLVQLTRKRLGTGLVEAFSTSCTQCAGRGIVLHGDPVDTASASAGRKTESTGGGRRSKRGKKGNARPEPEEEVQVVKVPAHAAAEHPMFRAMAAANGRPDEDHEGLEGFDEHADGDEHAAGETPEAEGEEQTTPEHADEYPDGEFGAQDSDDSDESDEDVDSDESDDDSDEDEIDLDNDLDDDDDDDDDLDDIDEDDSDEDEDSDDEDDSDEDEGDEPEEDVYQAPAPVVAEVPPTRGRTRRRAAARPAGPPSHE
ncbi:MULTISPECIES: Rne/Rng family ribonuclease [unclassified Mycolicibacterium]|uniref:Rne/Rng family ribonuclease n=1 Tax=unclassified Mycolicibacterium TaxID=2636767 RepID=UPI0013083B7D|nr:MULTISPECIES: Rne/Rng family ribonuclease [unclassified Mycolicibacterium]MUL83588.1 ribonuclease E/G [Mycolicibacterium sp. CBMA 329]MUL90579.1 ribonuclease E/G [Mycolicibacterium sp. CBMA 331]MUM00549.1 ribonuclease E/G [Mycolicibacterium sp. CBMA 334]MUM25441.1 ribonuclease E/G [Mycolicibacterium sp. CBMA 295]MUM41523.1 ribonuclease E/G [Mycolicibacterium sp. CBMA 247]